MNDRSRRHPCTHLPEAEEAICQTLNSSRCKINLNQAFRHSSVVATRLPIPGRQSEKVLTVSCRPDYFQKGSSTNSTLMSATDSYIWLLVNSSRSVVKI